QLDHLTGAAPPDERRQTKGQNPRGLRMRACQALDCAGVKMIVVIVRLQYEIERRQVVEGDSRRDPAPRPRELRRRGSLAPDRIRQHVHAVKLDQQTRVSDPGHGEVRAVRSGRYELGWDWSNDGRV